MQREDEEEARVDRHHQHDPHGRAAHPRKTQHVRCDQRGAYGRHVGEPAWESFVRRLSAASPYFAELWDGGDVVPTGPRVKRFRHEAVGEIRMTSVSLSIDGMPDCRIVVYTPDDEESRRRTAELRGLRGGR
ncbi:MmyB family transcriptional regulator [Streptomyces niveus]